MSHLYSRESVPGSRLAMSGCRWWELLPWLCMWPGVLTQPGSLREPGLLVWQLGAPKASVPRKGGGNCMVFSDSASEVTHQIKGRDLGATF